MDPSAPRGQGAVPPHAIRAAAGASSSWSPQARASSSQRPAALNTRSGAEMQLPPLLTHPAAVARATVGAVTRDTDDSSDTWNETELVQRRPGASASAATGTAVPGSSGPRRLTPHATHSFAFESKDDVEARQDAPGSTPHASAGAASSFPSIAAASAGVAASSVSPHSDEMSPIPVEAAAAAAPNSDEEEEEDADSDSDSDAAEGPTAAEVYARPLLYFKRAPLDRRRGNAAPPPPEQGPAQLLLPDSSMCLGFPPLKERSAAGGGGGGAGASAAVGPGAVRGDGLDDLDDVVVFTPPNEEQASKTKLFACLLLFLIPADLILICTIFFLGGAVVGDEVTEAGASDLVTFLCALLALSLGVVGLRLHDTRVLTLFIVVYYVDAVINLVRISSILQLAQFLMQISVCHVTALFKNSLVPQWWLAEA